MPKEIRVYIGRDPASKELFNQLVTLIKSLPKEQRPKLKVKALRIKDPSEFEAFLAQLEELFGGIYTLEFRKYDIKSIPTIIVDGKKVIEGKYPTPEELHMLILGEEIIPPPISEQPPITPDKPKIIEEDMVKPVEIEPIHTEPVQIQEQRLKNEKISAREVPPPTAYKEEVFRQEQPEEIKPIEIQPVELPEPIETQEQDIRIKEPETKIEPSYPQPGISPPAAPEAPPREELKKEEKEERLEPAKPAQPLTATRDLKNTCFTCIFYNEERKRCTLYHIKVEDPYNPPCGRGRR